jgi:hypothetical protein
VLRFLGESEGEQILKRLVGFTVLLRKDAKAQSVRRVDFGNDSDVENEEDSTVSLNEVSVEKEPL